VNAAQHLLQGNLGGQLSVADAAVVSGVKAHMGSCMAQHHGTLSLQSSDDPSPEFAQHGNLTEMQLSCRATFDDTSGSLVLLLSFVKTSYGPLHGSALWHTATAVLRQLISWVLLRAQI